MSAAALFTPWRLGPLQLRNRVVMAPMTRRRARPDGSPTPLMARYYAQRAGAGLIVAEATTVAPDAGAYPGSPGLHDDAHVAAWRAVTDAVHARQGRIFAQLWHAGRATHPDFLPPGALPVGPSAVAADARLRGRDESFPVPHALTRPEIDAIVARFGAAAARARAAGFDGVELHAGHGYLIDTFLRDVSNRRDDEYGGSPANRARLLLRVVAAASDAWAADRVGVQVTPTGRLHGMSDSAPGALFRHVAERLAPLGLAYLHVHEPIDLPGGALLTASMRAVWPGTLMVNGGYTGRSGAAAVAEGAADLVSFGRPFIANPDLPERLRSGAPLAEPDPATFYGGDAAGYTDYPPLAPPQLEAL